MTHDELAQIDKILERIKSLEEKVEELESHQDRLQEEIDHPTGCGCTACGNH